MQQSAVSAHQASSKKRRAALRARHVTRVSSATLVATSVLVTTAWRAQLANIKSMMVSTNATLAQAVNLCPPLARISASLASRSTVYATGGLTVKPDNPIAFRTRFTAKQTNGQAGARAASRVALAIKLARVRRECSRRAP